MKVLSLVLLAIITAACNPPCLRGHDEWRTVPRYCTQNTMPIDFGNGVIVHVPVGEDCIEAHQVTQFVCDEYQSEKFDSANQK